MKTKVPILTLAAVMGLLIAQPALAADRGPTDTFTGISKSARALTVVNSLEEKHGVWNDSSVSPGPTELSL